MNDEQRIAEIRERVKPPYDNDYYRKYFPEPDVMFLLTLLDEAREEATVKYTGSGIVYDFGEPPTPVELHLQGTVESLRRQLAEAKQTIGIQASTIVGLTEELHEVKVSNDSVKGIESEVTRLETELTEAKTKIIPKDVDTSLGTFTFGHFDEIIDKNKQLKSEVTRLRGALEKIASGDTTPEDFCLCGIPNRKCECADAIAEEALATKSEGGEG